MTLDAINGYVIAVIFSILIVVVAFLALAVYFLKIKKVSSEEEHMNYNSFNRLDAIEFGKFKDIVSSGVEGSPGMIALGNNRFVGGISVTGYNYHSASADERKRTMMNMISFFNIVEDRIQMRQTVQAIDIERNIEQTKQDAVRIEKELISLNDEYNSTIAIMQSCLDKGDDDLFSLIEKRAASLKHTIESKKWMLDEAKELIFYMGKVSDVNNNTKRINQVMFSYTYDPSDDIEELTEAEIYFKAQRELVNKADIYGSALENCGCSWRMLTADDLTNLVRRHNKPESVDELRLEELLNGSYSALYVTSDSLEELERERLGEEAYERELQAYENARLQKRAEAEEAFDNEYEALEKSLEDISA